MAGSGIGGGLQILRPLDYQVEGCGSGDEIDMMRLARTSAASPGAMHRVDIVNAH
jgi:hypothetical protein